MTAKQHITSAKGVFQTNNVTEDNYQLARQLFGAGARISYESSKEILIIKVSMAIHGAFQDVITFMRSEAEQGAGELAVRFGTDVNGDQFFHVYASVAE